MIKNKDIERIATSLEVIADGYKKEAEERKKLREQFNHMEQMIIAIRDNPFGFIGKN